MVLELNYSRMEIDTKGNMSKASFMGRVNIGGQMVAFTWVSF